MSLVENSNYSKFMTERYEHANNIYIDRFMLRKEKIMKFRLVEAEKM